jgi:hypothetical protein
MESRGLLRNGSTHSEEHLEHELHEHTYKYELLQTSRHIRLLQLAPGRGDAPLRCSLLQVDADGEQPYEAISYAWGNGRNKRYIHCDGKHIVITRNLFDALWYFRHPDHTRSLWADAACIDQQNIEERNAQVQLMASIYSKASTVLLWLGKVESDVAHCASEYFDHFKDKQLQRFREDNPGTTHSPSWDEIENHMPDTSLSPVKPDESARLALNELFRSQVFRRGWVRESFTNCSLFW